RKLLVDSTGEESRGRTRRSHHSSTGRGGTSSFRLSQSFRVFVVTNVTPSHLGDVTEHGPVLQHVAEQAPVLGTVSPDIGSGEAFGDSDRMGLRQYRDGDEVPSVQHVDLVVA